MPLALFNPEDMGTGNYGVRSPVLDKKPYPKGFNTPSKKKGLLKILPIDHKRKERENLPQKQRKEKEYHLLQIPI